MLQHKKGRPTEWLVGLPLVSPFNMEIPLWLSV